MLSNLLQDAIDGIWKLSENFFRDEHREHLISSLTELHILKFKIDNLGLDGLVDRETMREFLEKKWERKNSKYVDEEDLWL